MRISDWSSDVCSSDLVHWRQRQTDPDVWKALDQLPNSLLWNEHIRMKMRLIDHARANLEQQRRQIGRASCRERVCQYVSISVVAVSLKKKQYSKTNKK